MNNRVALQQNEAYMPNDYINVDTIHKTNRKVNVLKKNMIKQKACGLILVLCGLTTMLMEKDATAFIFLSLFFLPMIFSKQYIMNFKS